ncbi:MAG: hypothetical protein EOO46_00105 [Flavobacterium sp.]|nr:MAG: hypothetical protein EOO46_00105 [Flavobacterium sp.]
MKDADLRRQREWKFKMFIDENAYKHNDASETVEHSELVIQSICTVLDINYDETPCLLVSNKPSFTEFYKVDTGTSLLEKQLVALSNAATYLKEFGYTKPLHDLFLQFGISKLEDIPNVTPLKFKVVSKILEVVSQERIHINTSFSELKPNLQLLKGQTYTESDNEDRINEVRSLLSIFYKRDYRRAVVETEDYFPELPINKTIQFQIELNPIESVIRAWQNIEQSTRNYLKSANIIYNQYSEMLGKHNDYSIYTFPLCKAFEQEINLSVVQLMRREFGVPMPTYFCKHDPGKDNIPITPLEKVVQNPREIFLNKAINNKWIAPGLGESRIAFTSLQLQKPLFATDWASVKKLTVLNEHWKIIQRVRNNTAHMEPILTHEKGKLEQSLTKLNDEGILNRLTDLKNKLRS